MTHHRTTIIIYGLLQSLAVSPAAFSADAAPRSIPVEGGVTITAQHVDDSRIDNEALISIDLLTTLPAGRGEWTVYVEGNSSPLADAVSSNIGEANGDAGSATNRDDKGRFQVSELHYTLPVGEASLTLGLMDTSAFLDGSEVANDETSQFLGSTLVNNPTIEFPDYTLGAAYTRELLQDTLNFTIVVASSHGLGDNPDKSYSQLLEVDQRHKGLFAAAEIGYSLSDTYIRIGGWINTKDHSNLDGSGNGRENSSGVYTSIDGKLNEASWNLRAGLADDEVSQAQEFIGIALEHPFMGSTLGAGITHTGLSDKGASAGQDHTTQGELYLRYEYSDQLHISPSLQWIENSGFDSSGGSFDNSLTVLSARVNYSF